MVVQKGLITGKYFNFTFMPGKHFRSDSRGMKMICLFKRHVNRHIWASYRVSKGFFFRAKCQMCKKKQKKKPHTQQRTLNSAISLKSLNGLQH